MSTCFKSMPGRDAQTSATPVNASSTIARFTRKLSSISTSWKLCRSTVSKCLRVDTFSVWPRRASPTACAAALASPVVEPAKALSARTRSRKPRCPTSPYELRVQHAPRSSKRASRGHPHRLSADVHARKASRPHPVLHVRQIHEHRLQRGPECKCDHSYSHGVVPPQPCKAQGQLTNPSSRHRRPLLTTCCRTPSVLGP